MRPLVLMRTRGWLVAAGFAACAAAVAAGSSTQPAIGASASSVVGATVLSSTAINTAGCASMVPNRTDFGAVTAGSSTVTTLDCSVLFDSSNDTSRLRIRQSDAFGGAMWMPSRGALDPAFDTDGRATTATAPLTGNDGASAVAIQADGKIVTAGTCAMGGATGQDGCLARYNPDGSLDTTFDADGRVTTVIAPGTNYDGAFAVAVQADGRIITAGRCDMGGATGEDACLARHTTSGALDTSFDTDGIVTTATAPGTNSDKTYAVAVQADGKILTAGDCYLGGATGYDICLARYTTSGTLDTSFDTDGRVTTDIAGSANGDYAYAMAVQADGKIVTAGDCYMGGATGTDVCLARYTTSGALDTSFDTDGRVTTATSPGAGYDFAYAVTVQDDGKIIAAGYCDMGVTGYDVCLSRYTASGALDTTFDTDGRVTTAIATGNRTDTAYAVAVQADGRIVTAGECDIGGATWIDVCLARYNAVGSLDTTFDADGRVSTAIAPGAANDVAHSLAIQADGRIITAGRCDMGGATGWDACLASYDQGGRFEQYQGGVRDWTTPGTNHFAACLSSVSAATASWTANATCPASNGAHWNAVPTVAAEIASAATGIQGTANLRFGLRAASSQPAGAYIAPVTFEVAAP